MLENKLEVVDVTAVGQTGATSPADSASLVEKQTRTRRLFSTTQLFAFSLLYFGTWVGLGSSMYFSLLNGGPAAYFFNFILVSIGVLAQAGCLAELASIMPVAGAQYYWTYAFSPPEHRLFLTWLQGWATWLCYIAGLAGIMNSTAVNLAATVQIGANPDYVATGWQITVIVVAMLAFCTILNLWFFDWIPWIELGTGIVNGVAFVVTIVALWVMAPHNSPDFLLTRTKLSGWDNDFVSWNVGILTHVWLFIAFESVIHMGEETKNAQRAVPQAMMWAIITNILTGLVTAFTYLICIPPVEDMLNSPNPYIYLLKAGIGSKPVAVVVVTGIGSLCIGSLLSSFSATTRLTWAWARDGGLPTYFGHVDGSNRVPMRAVLLTCSLVLLLCLLNLGTETYVALGAITSLSALGSYFSYVIILAVMLHKRLTTGFKASQWSMGRLGLPINVFALVYTTYIMIWLPFPTTVPVTAATMNYCAPVFIAVISGAVGGWFLWAKDNWAGPNEAVADRVLRATSDS